MPQYSSMQNLGIFSKVSHSFSISNFELVWIIRENIKTAGAHPAVTRSERRRYPCQPCPDHGCCLAAHHIYHPPFQPPQPPPHAALKGAHRRRAPPFRSLLPLTTHLCSSRCADVDCCTSNNRASPLPAAPLPNRHLLELHPAPVHPCEPSSFGPSDPSNPSLFK
jgi:hypothetical protein